MLKRLITTGSGIFQALTAAPDAPCVWESTLNGPLVTVSGEYALRGLRRKFIGFYASARHCSACREFTKTLLEVRNANAAELEVIFISKDLTADEMAVYMQESAMPWPAVPFASPDNGMLREKLGIGGIPRLVIISPNGRLISGAGRADVLKHGNDAVQFWRAKAGARG